MKKIQFIVLILLITIGISGCASTGSVKPLSMATDVSPEEVKLTMNTKSKLHVGKRFTFLIAWNGIPVGRIMAGVEGTKEYRGYEVYVAKVVTESNKFLSKIYRVEDTYTSYVDTTDITSRRYEADREEGNYRKHVIVEYDFDKKEATYTSLTDGSVKKCPIKENVQDPVSSMCYFMTLPVKLGDEINITVNLNEKNYELYAKIESLDLVKVKNLDSLPAFRVRPYTFLKGKEVRKGSAWMYFSADNNRYPLYGVVRIPFGRVTATLRSIEDI